MKRTTIGKRILSLVLTGALVLPQLAMTPAKAAVGGNLRADMDPEGKVSLNFNTGAGGWDPRTSGERLWLDIADNSYVVDDFRYTITSANKELYEIDKYGYLKVKDGKTPTGAPVTVEATVNYYSDDDVLFADNVISTTKLFTNGTNYNYQILENSRLSYGQVARTGKLGITSNPSVKNAAPYKAFAGGLTNAVLTGWYYDPNPAEDYELYSGYEKEAQMGLHINQSDSASGTPVGSNGGGPASYLLGFARIDGGSATNYSGRKFRNGGASGGLPVNDQYTKTTAPRSEGWHRLTWTFTDEKLITAIDGETMAEVSTTTFADAKTLYAIGLTVNKGSSGANKAYVEGKHFVDDISVVRNGAELKTDTITLTIPVDYSTVSVTTHPADVTVLEDESAVFTVVGATDAADPSLTYQWYRNDTNTSAGGTAISGANSATLTVTDVMGLDGKYFYCAISDTAGGSAVSNAAKLTISADQRPDTPYNPSLLEDGTVRFGLNTRSNYEFSFAIYKQGESGDTLINTVTRDIPTDSSNVFQGASLLAELRGAGEGVYCYTVQAKDKVTGLLGGVSEKSGPLTLGKLPAPQNLTWQGATLKWDEIPGARAYTVQLYKNSTASGSAVTVNAPITERLMTLSGDGIYTATVQALANTATIYFDSLPSAQSPVMGQELRLTFDKAGLSKGSRERVYLEGPGSYGIDDFTFTSSNENVVVDQYGYVTVKDSAVIPEGGMDVTISAAVKYYDSTVWANNMESFGKFTSNELTTTHATNNAPRLHLMSQSELPGGEAARTGRMGATPYAVNGYGSNVSFPATTGSLIFWYYDPFTAEEMANADKGIGKYGVAINVSGPSDPAATNFTGIAYNDGTAVDTHYAYRTSGTNWANVSTARSAGWHKFEFRVTSAGMELYIDGVKARDLDASIKTITGLQLCNNWGTQGANGSYINGKHFIDDIYVIASGAERKEGTIQTTIRVTPKSYAIEPTQPEFDRNYPQDLAVTVSPDLAELSSVSLAGTTLTSGTDYVVAGNVLTLSKSVLAGKSVGSYTLALGVENGRTVSFAVKVIETASRAYYVDSKDGSDSNDGATPATAWKTLSKLNAIGEFQFGDQIYLQEEGVWNEQLVLQGQGRSGRPIILTKYAVVNGEVKYGTETGTTKRPVINGMGTEGVKPSYIVEGNSSGDIKLNGAVELWNSGWWEISWLEVTNLGPTPGNGRSGIMVINDYTPGSYSERTSANWWASKKEHIYITDCYVHDVNGRHQNHSPGGTKHAGGIIGYGYLSDFRVERSRVSRVDNEGIRNTIFHPGGTNSPSGYPANAETQVFFKNNFIDKVAGDAMVMAGVNFGEMSYNVATTLGRSYVSAKSGANLSPTDTPVLLGNANYAAMWVMGCKNSVAQYNEVFDTQYDCPDGEAWDIDLYSENYVYQYNYSHRNSGGSVLFMNGSKNNIFRYNLSIEDGGYANRPHLVYYAASGSSGANAYPLIYNNVFALSSGITSLFDGNTTHSSYLHFQNNIVYANNDNKPNLFFRAGEVIDGGSFTNNIFWPASLYGTNITGYLGSGMTVKDNIVADPKLVGGGPTDIPVLSGDWFATWDAGGYLTSDNWFDARVNQLLGGYKLQPGSPAIDAGVRVPYWTDIPVANRFPIERDFFGNPIDESDPSWVPDIGIQECSNEAVGGKYTVTFDKNGGAGEAEPSSVQVESGTALGTLPAAPQGHLGYRFVGWNTAPDGSGALVTAATIINSSLTVYAQWVHSFTVTFRLNDGTESVHITKTVESPATTVSEMPEIPVRSGFKFKEWNIQADGSGAAFTSLTQVSGDVTVYAQWVANASAHVVIFDKNGGDTDAAPGSILVEVPATTVGALPAQPTRAGYRFMGWNTKADGTGAVFTSNTAVTGDLTVYAQWSYSYTVTFRLNNGTDGVHATRTVEAPATTVGALPANPVNGTRAFLGWNTEADGTGIVFTGKTKLTGDLTVYAQWSYTYTVTFDSNGGDAAPVTAEVATPATTVGALPAAPLREGYVFLGWNTAADGSGSAFNASTAVTADLTVYAQWIEESEFKTFKVTFDSNGGNGGVVVEVTTPATTVGTLPTSPTREGYRFLGWNTQADGAGSSFTASTPVSGDLTVYAQWEKISTGGSGGGSTPTQPAEPEKPAGNVTAGGGGSATVKENPDGTATYTFKPDEGKKILFVRVNGISVPVSEAYTAEKGEDPSIVVIFGEEAVNASERFDDVAGLPAYAQSAIGYVASAGLFNGTGERAFAPQLGMNRAMFATVIARLYGAKTQDYASQSSGFTDVAEKSWYDSSVAWGAEMDVIRGVGGGKFAPNQDLTRQELVTLLHRFAAKVGADASAAGDLSAFRDASKVSPWASEAMSWAVGLGLINGRGADLDPTAPITRAEAAVILERVSILLVKSAD